MTRAVGRRPAIAAVAGALAIAFSAPLVALADVAPSAAAVYRCAYALPLLAVLAWLEERHGGRPPRDRLLMVPAGILFGADLVFWHHAIADVGAGLATVLGNLQVVIVPLAAWAVLGERGQGRVLASLPLICSGVLLISGVLETGAYGADPARGVLFGALTGVAYAGVLLILRQSSLDLQRSAGPLFEMTAAAAVTALVAAILLGQADLVPTWPAHAWLVTLALTSQVLGWLLISVSLPRLPAALSSVTLTIQPVGSVLLGVVLLGEEPSLLQLAGVALILTGLVSVALRRAPARDAVPEPA